MLTVTQFRPKMFLTPLFLLIFSAMFLSTLGDQIITDKIEALVSSKDGLNNMIWIWGTLSLFNAIILPMLTALYSSYMVVQYAEKNEGAFKFTTRHFEMLTIETFRSWGKAFLWSFVFVLPGIWKFFTYTLIPYIVFFSKKYQNGEVDALEYSTYICKKNWKAVNKWLTVFYLVVPIASYFLFEPYRVLATTPIRATLLIALKTMVEFAFHYQMLKILIDYINKNEADPEPESTEPPPSEETVTITDPALAAT